MGAVATFNYETFVQAFPEFAAVNTTLATSYFNRAAMIFGNDGSGPVQDAVLQLGLLNLLAAHVAWLNAPRDANGNPASSGLPPPQVVGRISSASEGSVSVSAEWDGSGGPTQAWYLQTRYGAEFWAATAQFRTFRYSSRPTVVRNGAPFARQSSRW